MLLRAVGNTSCGLDPNPVRTKSFHRAQCDSDRSNDGSHLCSGIEKGGFMDFLAPPITKRCNALLCTFRVLSPWVYFSSPCGMFLVWSEWWLTVRLLLHVRKLRSPTCAITFHHGFNLCALHGVKAELPLASEEMGFTPLCWATSVPQCVPRNKGCVCETVKPETLVLPNCRNKKLSVITAENKSPLLGAVWPLKFFTRSCYNMSMYK